MYQVDIIAMDVAGEHQVIYLQCTFFYSYTEQVEPADCQPPKTRACQHHKQPICHPQNTRVRHTFRRFCPPMHTSHTICLSLFCPLPFPDLPRYFNLVLTFDIHVSAREYVPTTCLATATRRPRHAQSSTVERWAANRTENYDRVSAHVSCGSEW